MHCEVISYSDSVTAEIGACRSLSVSTQKSKSECDIMVQDISSAAKMAQQRIFASSAVSKAWNKAIPSKLDCIFAAVPFYLAVRQS